MMTEKELAQDNSIQANVSEDRDLDNRVVFWLDDRTLAALDGVTVDEGFRYRSAFIRSVIRGALIQRGKL